MRYFSILIGFVVLVGCVTPAFAQAAPARTVVERHGKLGVKGNRIVDAQGRPVILRGMSLFWSQWGGQYFNAECVKWLRDDWQCTVVRAAVAVGSGGYLKNPEAEQKKAEAVIQAAIDLGIYVIVDWHAHDPEPAAAKTFFSAIAAKYGKHPNLIYETYNEPIRHDWATVLKPYHESVISSIREHDADNLIVCGTPMWSQSVDQAAADPIDGKNIAYTLHFYAASHKQWLRDRAKAAMDRGIALMVTEWGTSEANGDGKLDDVETQKWLAFMDENGLSWCNWSVIGKKETSAALTSNAPANGGWPDEILSPSGKLVREAIRQGNASPAQ